MTHEDTPRRLSRRALLRRGAAVGLGVPLVAKLLSACGADEDEGSAGAGTLATVTATDATGTAVVEPRRGGTLRVALTGEPPNLDLMQTTDSLVLLVTAHMYETLFTWDATYRPVTMLADTHEVSEDGLVHTLNLRHDVPFHNGEIMTAADVIASVRRWGSLSGLGEGLLVVTDDIVAIDEHTVEFRLSEPFGTFAMALSRQLQGCAIYPKSVVDASSATELAEYVGTGPYRFVEWLPDQRVRVERFADYARVDVDPDGYARARAQYLDTIDFIPVRSEASRIAGIQSGDYHYLETFSPDQTAALAGRSGVAVDSLPADNWLNVVLNLRSPVLADPRVRRAFQLALDHEAIMQAAVGEPFYELTPELVPGAPTWFTLVGAEYFNQHRPDESRRLLQEAGYGGSPLRVLTTQEIQQEYNATLTMKQQLEAVGFTIDLQVYDGATLADRRDDETLWETYTATASFRPDPVMRNLTASASGWWENEAKDTLLAELQRESDYDKRFAIWEQVQRAFYEDVPRLKIGNIRRVLARSSRLQGIGPTELQPDFANAWLEE